MNRIVALIVTLFLCFLLPVNAGSLFVGTKVIYPGGANQPPKEKDTGTSLKASARGNFPEKVLLEDLENLFDDEDYETLLIKARLANNKEAKVYEAIALFRLNRKKAAKTLARVLLKDKGLTEEASQQLCDELDIDAIEDLDNLENLEEDASADL